jgi:hypothetical protein
MQAVREGVATTFKKLVKDVLSKPKAAPSASAAVGTTAVKRPSAEAQRCFGPVLCFSVRLHRLMSYHMHIPPYSFYAAYSNSLQNPKLKVLPFSPIACIMSTL